MCGEGDVLRVPQRCVRELEAGAHGVELRVTGAQAGDAAADFWWEAS